MHVVRIGYAHSGAQLASKLRLRLRGGRLLPVKNPMPGLEASFPSLPRQKECFFHPSTGNVQGKTLPRDTALPHCQTTVLRPALRQHTLACCGICFPRGPFQWAFCVTNSTPESKMLPSGLKNPLPGFEKPSFYFCMIESKIDPVLWLAEI